MVGGLVQPCDACGDFARVAPLLNRAVEADDDIVADFAPAAFAMPLVNLRGGGIERLPVASVRGGVPDDSFYCARLSCLLTLLRCGRARVNRVRVQPRVYLRVMDLHFSSKVAKFAFSTEMKLFIHARNSASFGGMYLVIRHHLANGFRRPCVFSCQMAIDTNRKGRVYNCPPP